MQPDCNKMESYSVVIYKKSYFKVVVTACCEDEAKVMAYELYNAGRVHFVHSHKGIELVEKIENPNK